MIAAVFIVGSALLIAAFVWSERATNLTHEQRLAMIDFIFSHPELGLLGLEFEEVSFGQHYRAVLFFRDPARLYSARLAAALQGRAE